METTRLSSKGQIIVPQSIREAYRWEPGMDFIVTELENAILLTPVKSFEKSTVQELLGCVGYKGKKKTLQQMEEGIKQGAKEHGSRDRH